MAERIDVLTDLASGTWHDSYRLTAADGISLEGGRSWSIAKRTLRGGVSDGIDVVSIDNGVLSVDVLPTRGMGLWRGMHRGTYLGWESPVRYPVHPALVNRVDQQGLGWLTGFNEWMCRCGLSSLGDPGLDIVKLPDGSRRESPVTLHGRIANTPCQHVSVGVNDQGTGTLMVRGVMQESWLFGPKLQLVSTLSTTVGSSSLRIVDEVTNFSDEPGELQLMYHINVGRPLLEGGARLVAAAAKVAPYDQLSARNIEDWASFDGPQPGFGQVCYFVEPIANEAGRATVLFHNRDGDKAIGLQFSTRELPCFTVWKNLQGSGDGYVTGLEPGTCFPNLISFERSHGRVVTLPPGGSRRTCLEISIYDGTDAVRSAEQTILSLNCPEPTMYRQVHPSFAPVEGTTA